MKKVYLVILLVLVTFMFGCECNHEWTEASCQGPGECVKCGETTGKRLKHSWIEATCEVEKHCEMCGKTEGVALGHLWENATCTKAKECSVCHEIEGEALGHEWEEATCVKAKTCSVCKETDGKALGHKKGDWDNGVLDITNSKVKYIKKCEVCNEIVTTKYDDIKTFVDNKMFMFTPEQFSKRLSSIMSNNNQSSMCKMTQIESEESTYCWLYTYSDVQGVIEFTDKNDVIAYANRSKKKVGALMVGFFTGADETETVMSMVSVIMACDPTLDFDEAKDVCTKTLEAYIDGGTYRKNKITYAFYITDSGKPTFWVSALK